MTGVPRVVGGLQVAQAGICVECCPTANVGGAKVSAVAGVLSRQASSSLTCARVLAPWAATLRGPTASGTILRSTPNKVVFGERHPSHREQVSTAKPLLQPSAAGFSRYARWSCSDNLLVSGSDATGAAWTSGEIAHVLAVCWVCVRVHRTMTQTWMCTERRREQGRRPRAVGERS